MWSADFDHNSRRDLLIAEYSSKSGRCTDEVRLSFLLFNEHGRPVPWVIQTRAPSFRTPAIFTDLNHNGRAELVVTDCTYRYPGAGVDRRITGIYEAKDAMWSLIKPDHLDPYTALVRQNHRFNAQVHLLPANVADWLDQGNRLGPDGPPPVELSAVLTASEECHGIRLPPIVNGALQRDWKDPCDELGHNRIQLSDGTICYDWPTVMLDGEDGREIVAGSEHPELLLQKIIEQRRRLVLVGQRESKRCSPVLLWAFWARPWD